MYRVWRIVFLAIIVGLLTVGTFINAAFAVVDARVLKISDGTLIEYNQVALSEAFQAKKILGIDDPMAALFKDYFERSKPPGKLFAYHDSVKGYIEYDDIKDAYSEARMSNVPFLLDSYIGSDTAKVITVTDVKSTKVVDGTVIVYDEPPADSLIKEFDWDPSYPGVGVGTLIVILKDNVEPTEYEVTAKDVKLIYNPELRAFSAEITASSVVLADITVSIKEDESLVKSVVWDSGFPGFGTGTVIVKLVDTVDATMYKVTAKGVELVYSPQLQVFSGEIEAVSVTEADITVTPIGDVELKVEDIY